MSPGAAAAPSLRRSVTFPWLVLYGLGTTIGAGIYALTGVVAGRAGLHAPVCFGLASLIALFTALSFAELSSRFPRAGGEAVYVIEGLRRDWLATAVGLLVIAAGLISAATVTLAFAGYLTELVPVPRLLALLAAVALVGGLAAWGVRESVTVAGMMTLVEVGGLLLVVAYGGGALAELPARGSALLPATPTEFQAVGSAAILAFYAFLGFEDMVNVAEEVRDVRRVLPLAILTTLAVTALLYLLVSLVAVLSVPPQELALAKAPLALVLERSGGPAGLLGVIALFALLNGALIQVMKSARVLYGLAGERLLPARFGQVHPRTHTPLFATGLATLVVTVLALAVPLASLARATSLVTLVTFALANLALVRVKRREPAPEGATLFPLWVPVTGLLLNGLLLASEVAERVAG